MIFSALPTLRAQSNRTPPPFPRPEIRLPFDLDGDGRSLWSEVYVVNYYLSLKGNIGEILLTARTMRDVIVVSLPVVRSDEQLMIGSLAVESGGSTNPSVFRRGDADNSQSVNMADAIYILEFLF